MSDIPSFSVANSLGHDEYDDMTEHPPLMALLPTDIAEGVPRGLAASESVIDYTVLSVSFITLGLILLVELLRQRIDQSAHGRPFAKTVLEGVYRELSTLGIVEFAIFIAHTYAADFNLEIEAVFAKVHFLLFFTAIINALMSVLLALVSFRISYNMWVRTEELELNHYLAIREEFSRVEGLMGEFQTAIQDQRAEHTVTWRRAWTRLVQTVRYPLVRRQYDKLLVQVRFHELRLHFLKANELPIKLKVSDYLVKSELHVLKKCVHISTFAWIMVAAAVNLFYFLLGIVAYVSESPQTIGKTMTWIFIGTYITFIPISYIIFCKMQWIFARIMKMRLIDCTEIGGKEHDARESSDVDQDEDAEIESASRKSSVRSFTLNTALSRRSSSIRKGVMNQLDLFWGSDPQYIIGAFQFMQLGYAIAASILLIFWDSIDVMYASVRAKHLITSLILCYLIFLWILAQVVPRYTLCISLGQLVNRRRLHETLAKYKLEEARRKRRYFLEESLVIASIEQEAKKIAAERRESKQKLEQVQVREAIPRKPQYSRQKSVDTHKMEKLVELVQTSTARLPASSQSFADIRREQRKRRIKSVSDGVAFMRRISDVRVQSEAASSALAQERHAEATLKAPVGKAESEAAAESGLLPRSNPPGGRVPTRRTRSGRKKSMSANVASMRSTPDTFFFTAPNETVRRLSIVDEEGRDKSERRPSLDDLIMPGVLEDIPSRATSVSDPSLPLRMMKSRDDRKIPEDKYSSPFKSFEAPNVNSASQEAPRGGLSFSKSRQKTEIAVSGVPELAIKDETADDDTTGTHETEGGQSDFEDVPDVTESVKSKKILDDAGPQKSSFNWSDFLQSRRYRFMSGVFGTMVAFFIVGMRVEAFLIESGTIIDTKNTWHMNLYSAFYMEVAWLSAFILESSLILLLFVSLDCVNSGSFHLVIAAVSDIILSIICLSMLLWAETKRCCESDPSRSLADAEVEVEFEIDTANCCPKFGSRTYGGLGNIEVFTCLIGLRVFRLQFGKMIRNIYLHGDTFTTSLRWKCNSQFDEYVVQATASPSSANNLRSSNALVLGHNKKKTLVPLEDCGTIVDLWQTGIGLYPEVVEKYGEFSGELLQAMLGIEIAASNTPLDRGSQSNASINGGFTSEGRSSTPRSVFENMLSVSEALSSQIYSSDRAFEPLQSAGDGRLSSPILLGKKYSKLIPEAQEVILAGKVGRPVKLRNRSDGTDEGFAVRSIFPPPERNIGGSLRRTKEEKLSLPEFELDNTRHNEEHATDNDPSYMFVNPNARLIRSMHRCERRLPPMLSEWAVVDVVVTNAEIVYFDSSDEVETAMAAATEGSALSILHKKKDIVRKAMEATKGGKGLRLRDVAIGRTVVGQLDLSDITAVKVERFPSAPGKDNDEKDQRDVEGGGGLKLKQEYWKRSCMGSATILASDSDRWKQVVEDRLKLISTQGSLYLRFFSDLDLQEANRKKGSTEGEIEMNDTLHWCQTIVRLRGLEQLEQKLPNFGENGSSELLDYIEFLSREMDDTVTGNNKLRRMRSRMRLIKSDVEEVAGAQGSPRHGQYLYSGDLPRMKDIVDNTKKRLHSRGSSSGSLVDILKMSPKKDDRAPREKKGVTFFSDHENDHEDDVGLSV